MLFAGVDYEASGGMGDFMGFIDKFDTKTALDMLHSVKNGSDIIHFDWAHIYDVEEGIEVGITSGLLKHFGLGWQPGDWK
jgi:hypothetical protein